MKIAVIGGDGTGPELAQAARKCVDATDVKMGQPGQVSGGVNFGRTVSIIPVDTVVIR